MPTGGTETNDRGSVVLVDPAQVRTFVEERSAAREEAARRTQEAAAAPAPEPPPPLEIEAPHYVVHVRNGSGVNGLAGQVLERLTGLGFVRGTVDNTADAETSTIRHRDSDDAADAVAEQLGGFEVEQDDAVPSGHLQVVAGCGRAGDDPRAARRRRPRPDAGLGGRAVDHGRRRTVHRLTVDRPFRRGPVTLTAALLDPYLTRLRGRPAADHLLRRRHRRARRAVRDDHRELGREGREPAARRVRRRAGHAGRRAAARALADGGGAAGGVVVRRGGGRRPRRGGRGCCATPAGVDLALAAEPAGGVVALSLDAFGKGIPGLPAGVVDFAPEVRLHGDDFTPWDAVPGTAPGARGLDGGRGPGRRARAGRRRWASVRTTGCSRRSSGAPWTA